MTAYVEATVDSIANQNVRGGEIDPAIVCLASVVAYHDDCEDDYDKTVSSPRRRHQTYDLRATEQQFGEEIEREIIPREHAGSTRTGSLEQS